MQSFLLYHANLLFTHVLLLHSPFVLFFYFSLSLFHFFASFFSHQIHPTIFDLTMYLIYELICKPGLCPNWNIYIYFFDFLFHFRNNFIVSLSSSVSVCLLSVYLFLFSLYRLLSLFPRFVRLVSHTMPLVQGSRVSIPLSVNKVWHRTYIYCITQ